MLGLLAASSALAGTWFEACAVDYWGPGTACVSAGRDAPEANPVPEAPKDLMKKGPRDFDADPFDWRAYEDPGDPRFWDDGGEWVPPRPLREVLADPSAENIARYRVWVGRKLELAQMGQELVWGPPPTHAARAPVEVAPRLQPRPELVPWDRLKVIYFYQASCGHCQASIPLVHELDARGVEVLTVHLDRPSPAHPDSVPYTRAMAELLQVEGTPTWVLELDGRQGVLRGRTTLAELAAGVEQLRNAP